MGGRSPDGSPYLCFAHYYTLTFMQRNDYLWKGIIEHVTDDFLRFFFPDADTIFDMEKGFYYLDKELAELFPREDGLDVRFVDKLIKVFTKSAPGKPSEEKWILVHLEVQGYRDPDFHPRMHTYFYRIFDRYRRPVTAIAILTDGDKNYRPEVYRYEFLGTSYEFRFNTYKVLDQDEEALEKDSNPFAVVVLTVLIALKNKKLPDKELFELKSRLLRNLVRRRIPRVKIEKLVLFLQFYVVFRNKAYNKQFEEEIVLVTETTKSMGIKELILEKAREEGLERGLERSARNLIKASILTDEQIAAALEVSVDYVASIRRGMAKEG